MDEIKQKILTTTAFLGMESPSAEEIAQHEFKKSFESLDEPELKYFLKLLDFLKAYKAQKDLSRNFDKAMSEISE